ncbi:hypothetical protein D0Z07_8054 [Hyphodiscus hymeniophilus]|uniref:BCD1 alpha/beta domain-containing protein n=1 Tax=Hyphodiscus hymeniophilus TaxID=353542 RepID=A0A9P6VDD8_9HELO|nr:hypothetical protein D0Z07_8054 [Hyphodiscus hymeniophilus]
MLFALLTSSQALVRMQRSIDHDYNFLHSIEHKIERSEKRIVEDRGLVEKGELVAARRDQNPDEWRVKMRKRKRQNPGQEPIERCLKMMRTTVELAPKGMKRSEENATTWSKGRRTIHWQVEWIHESNAARSLSKIMGNKPIGEGYAEHREEERKSLLTDVEKRLEKKQKAKDREREILGRVTTLDLSALSILQDPETAAWGSAATHSLPLVTVGSTSVQSNPSTPGYHFYLLRPQTPSSFPKVLTPLNPAKPLEKLLRRRLVLEFPTIYVLKAGPDDLSEGFVLESDYLYATRQPPWQDSDIEMQDRSESSSDGDTESETSSSGSESDDIVEEGEISE